MRVHTAPSSTAAWCLLIIATASCQSSKQLGSACPGGICPAQAAVQGPACLASNYSGEIALGEGSEALCLASALPTDGEGRPKCEVRWDLPWPNNLPGGPTDCGGHDFLSGSPDTGGCVVRHLTAAERAAGELDGWYYERDESGPCAAAGAIRFTAGVDRTAGKRAWFSCGLLQMRDDDGDVQSVEIDECAVPPEQVDGSSVGDPCMPGIVPSGAFDPREAYVEIGSPECATGMCLVFQLDGDPSAECRPSEAGPRCAPPAEVEATVYCSCRCDLPGGGPGDGCDCPDGFACQSLLEGGAEAVNGGFCVRNDGITGPPPVSISGRL